MGALKLFCAAGVLLAISGCATLGGSVAKVDHVELTQEASQAIAGDLVSHLVREIGQGAVTIVLDSAGTEFAGSLDGALRQAGYAVIARGTGDDQAALGYVVEPFEDWVLVQLTLPDLSLGRLYQLDHGTAKPAGPIAVRRADHE